LLLSPQTIHASEPVLRIVTEDTIPINYLEKGDPEVKGYATDLVKAIMKEAGLDYKIHVLPWARAYKEAQNNKNTLIYSIGRIPKREDQFIWMTEIIELKNYIFSLNTNKHLENQSIEKLRMCKTAIIRADINYVYLKQKRFEDLVFVNSYQQIFSLLLRDRIQCFAASGLGAESSIIQQRIKKGRIIPILELPELNISLYFAANRETDRHIIEKIKTSFQHIKENGDYLKIMQPLLDLQKSIRENSN